MANNSVYEYLKHANLQMAAEALLGVANNSSSSITTSGLSRPLSELLPSGNNHASKFSPSLMASFLVESWEVAAHQPNTSTGFSATLFKKGNEFVLSFRSTEFVDDAVRDNQATNKMEIKDQGWALGQIADMEAWWAKLKADGKVTGQITVTGYSLGGHLATAFTLLHAPEVNATYTFNGAGVGDVHSNTNLGDVVDAFQRRRINADGKQIQFTDPRIQNLYQSLRGKLNAGTRPTQADFTQIDITVGSVSDKTLLRQALSNIQIIWNEIDRVAQLQDANAKPVSVTPLASDGRTLQIDALRLDYQIAVLMAAPSISPYRTNVALSGWDAYGERNIKGLIPGVSFYDIFGAQSPSGVANSQWHYGEKAPIYIEDQPLARGNVILSALGESIIYADAKLLVNNYTTNDFGDTHSLVLLVDSLAVQDLLARLDPNVTEKDLSGYLSAATNTKGNTLLLSQGEAEGYTLEVTVDGLFKTLTGIDRRLRFLNAGSGTSLDTGNTWHDITAREALHKAITDLKATDVFKALVGKVTLVTPATDSGSSRNDFGQFLALIHLTPFALKTTDATALAALKNANPSLAQAWEADAGLSAAQRAAGLGHYSDLWLADRAAMLSWMLDANRDNQTFIKSAKVGDEAWSFRDVDSGGSILVLPEKPLSSTAPHHYVTFGGSGNDALSGADLADHLYGGDGNDTLTGHGGAGRDLLLGACTRVAAHPSYAPLM